MKKKTILNTIRKKSALKIGTVTAVDSNGIEISIKGNSTTMRIPNSSGNTYNIGDSVSLGQFNGNSQMTSVIGSSGYIGA